MERKLYKTDLSDEQWACLQPLIPHGKAKNGGRGRQRSVDMREVLNAIFYCADNGCKWNALPHHFPPSSTVHGYFSKWVKKGVWQQLNDELRKQVRLKEGREADPSLAMIDSQSVKTAQKRAMCPAVAAEKRVSMVAKRLKAVNGTFW
jgi:putative transposase